MYRVLIIIVYMDNIDRIYCINMAHRTDRWEHCVKNFDKLNVTNYQRIDGQKVQHSFLKKNNNANLGLIKSMMCCFNDCIINNYNNILIFEDDFLPTEYFNNDVIKNTINDVYATNDWDMLYLGYRKKGEIKRYNDNLNRIYGAYTTHAILYNRKYIEYLLNELPQDCWDNNKTKNWIEQHRAIDVYFSKESNVRKYYCGKFNFFTQMPSHSDIANEWVDYTKLIS